jgi:hypothetical protein
MIGPNTLATCDCPEGSCNSLNRFLGMLRFRLQKHQRFRMKLAEIPEQTVLGHFGDFCRSQTGTLT